MFNRFKEWYIQKTDPEMWNAILAVRELSARILAGEPYEDVVVHGVIDQVEWDREAEKWSVTTNHLRTGERILALNSRGGAVEDAWVTGVSPKVNENETWRLAGIHTYYLSFEEPIA